MNEGVSPRFMRTIPALFLVAVALAAPAPPPTRIVDFHRDIEPLFRAHCLGCHGPATQQSGLRLDDRTALVKGGDSGKPAIVPGNSAASPLIQRVAGLPGLTAMPPAGPRLSTEQIAVLRAWIDQGAPWTEESTSGVLAKVGPGRPEHWAFQPIRKPGVASNEPNPIDGFVHARLLKEGVAPSPEASRNVLLRRLSLDLVGLPPTREEISEFQADTRPDAYERQVDRLLASPHYGEKWARHWLDQARYADSDGYEKDWSRPYAWRYREWVIDALNRDMPFDRFTIEQIAGDELPDASVEQKVATGFQRNTLTNREGGIDTEQFRFENLVDRTATVGTVWLGLTIGCAQCHDHKYDPLKQRDFYRLAAFFDNVEEVDIDAAMPGELGPWLAKRGEYRAKRDQLLTEYHVPELQTLWEKDMLRAAAHPGERTDWDLAWDCLLKLTEGGDGEKIMRQDPPSRTQREQDILTDHFVRNYHFAVGDKKYKELKFNELDKKLRELYAAYPQLTRAMTLADSTHTSPTRLRVRGDYKNPGIIVEPGVPEVLAQISAPHPTRLDLARWIVSRDNPLTGRVAVNRVWQEYFGQGLVKTSEDFGTQGERPTHPELLDWLAAELMDSDWSLKHIHRLIVTSATYKQSSNARPELENRDPNNALLARQSRLRLPAELIRDAALSSSGLLDLAIGGPSVRPPQPKGVSEIGYSGNHWEESTGTDRYRRGLYIHFQRTTPYPLLSNFDAPKGTVPACRRLRTDTPLQALNLLNDPVFLEAAQALAEQLQPDQNFALSLHRLFLRTLAREPSDGEALRLRSYFDRERGQFGDGAAWASVAGVLLNLDEFIMRE
jgi:mono/diheme cytochrome c family protein